MSPGRLDRIVAAVVLVVLLAIVATTASASAPGYRFTLVADAGPGSGFGFDQIHSASLNDHDLVAFAAVSGGTVSVYVGDGRKVTAVAGLDQGFSTAVGPVINDAGAIAFVGSTDDVDTGVFLFHQAGGPAKGLIELLIDGTAAGADLLGQLAIGDASGPPVVYWSACFGFFDCDVAQQCVRAVAMPGPFECVPSPGSNVAAPTLAAGTVAWLRSAPGPGGHELSLQVVEGGPARAALTVDQATGFISAPRANTGGQIAVYAGDPSQGLVGGIYLASRRGPPVLVARLDGAAGQTALITTQPFVDDEGRVAYAARFVPPAEGPGGDGPFEALFNGLDQPLCPIVAEGEDMFGSTLASPIRLYGLENSGSMVMTTALADGRTALVLVTNDGCAADIDGDGEVDVDDLIEVILRWQEMGCGVDITNDGVIDKDDLLEIIEQWGACTPP